MNVAAWQQMVDYLNGGTMSQPCAPTLPRHRHVCADEPPTAAEIEQAIAGGATAAEIAALAGITRQAAHARINRQKGHPQHGTL